MGFKKKFIKSRTKVIIVAPQGNEGHWGMRDWGTNKCEENKIFEVVDKEEVYDQIKKGVSIDLSNKYIRGFSLREYKEKNDFKGRVTLKDFNAKEAFFDGGADFSWAGFEGYVSFWGATFDEGDVNFQHTTFGARNISFRFATFWGSSVSFWQATFGEGDVSFECVAVREGDVSFEHATFRKGKVSFSGAICEKSIVNFTYLKIEGNWDMRIEANIVDFSYSIIYGTIDFRRAKITQLRLTGTQLTGTIFISSKELRLEKGELLLGRRTKSKGDAIHVQQYYTTHEEKREQFRLLKENFRSLGQYDDEDRAYFWLKYHEIRAEAEIEKTDNWKGLFKKKLVYGFKRVVFELMGKYGTAPRNVAVSMGIVWWVWTVFYFIGLKFGLLKFVYINPVELSLVREIGLSMYHSGVTFLTFGYGDIYSTGFLRICSVTEGFMGFFLTSYFIVSFARKVLR